MSCSDENSEKLLTGRFVFKTGYAHNPTLVSGFRRASMVNSLDKLA